jgi:hypothetical protein
MCPREGVHTVDLNVPEVVEDSVEIAAGARTRARAQEPVKVEEQAACTLIVEDREGHLTTVPTLKVQYRKNRHRVFEMGL